MPDKRAIGRVVIPSTSLARRRVEQHFCALHAITPDDAIEYAPPGPIERREFERLVKIGAMRRSSPGHFWIDLSRVDAEKRASERRKAPIAIALSVVMALLVMLLYRY